MLLRNVSAKKQSQKNLGLLKIFKKIFSPICNLSVHQLMLRMK